MKILIVGATGTIGKHVTAALQKDHEVRKAGSKSADIQVDISSNESIENFYKQVGKFDALICAAGDAQFGPLASMKDADVRIGVNSEDPIVMGANAGTMNGAINGFVKGAAIAMSRVTQAYLKSVLDGQTGQIYKVL
jgi:dTDP-4-dehydrorhamnose reductase